MLCWIAFDDFKSRSIRVLTLLILFITLVVSKIDFDHPLELIFNSVVNFSYLLLLTLLVYTYLKVKYKIRITDLENFIGLGDAFFLACISVWFEWNVFIVFCTVSFLVSLILHFVFGGQRKTSTIPLAGYQSLCFLLFYMYSVYN